MIRKPVRPLVLDTKKNKRDYKSILEEIQNDGEEFDTQSRTDLPALVAKQAVKVSKPSRGRHI